MLTLIAFLHIRPIALALLSLALILSFSSCVKREHHQSAANFAQANTEQSRQSQFPLIVNNQEKQPKININTAPAAELETLPGIGKSLAARIIEHRGKYGPFRRPEHLIIVRGISDKRFRALRELITVE